MKLFLEEESGTGKEKSIKILKEVTSLANAVKDKTAKKCFIHKCFHDEKDSKGQCKPCTREVL